MLDVAGPADAGQFADLHGQPVLDLLTGSGMADFSDDGTMVEITTEGARRIRSRIYLD